ncbi:MAG: DUF4350 domain-containing protein [Elainella sp.]
MTGAPQNLLKNRWVWLGLLLTGLLLLSLFFAPSPGQTQGSTYSRAPSGYGAWYAYMQSQTQIQRWQRPLNDLEPSSPLPPTQQVSLNSQSPPPPHLPTSPPPPPLTPITLIRVNSRSPGVSEDWIRRGNVLVLVGRRAPVTAAPFRQTIASPDGAVQIATSRRFDRRSNRASDEKVWLEDRFGPIVQEQTLGQGRVIAVVTPYLAANAYQDAGGNFKFLARLVTEPGYPIYIDEYLHGYRDQQEQIDNAPQSWLSYFAQTPVLLLAVQAAVLLLLLVWGEGQRLGPAQPLPEPRPDNSAAYIQALAGVLEKAGCEDFVGQTIGRAEQLRLQRDLGLGTTLLEPQVVIDAWVKQTGRPAAELEFLVQASRRPRGTLKSWLAQVRALRRPSSSASRDLGGPDLSRPDASRSD